MSQVMRNRIIFLCLLLVLVIGAVVLIMHMQYPEDAQAEKKQKAPFDALIRTTFVEIVGFFLWYLDFFCITISFLHADQRRS